MVSRPWRIKARWGCGEAEKLAQTVLTVSRSCKGRASKAWDVCQHYVRISDLALTHLLEFEIGSLVCHPLVPWAEFALWGSRGRVDDLWGIHLVNQRLFALQSHGGVSRIMGGRRGRTCSRLGQFGLGESVAEVGFWGRHGIRRGDACGRGYLTQPSTGRICSDLNRMRYRFREMSPLIGHVRRGMVLQKTVSDSRIITTQDKTYVRGRKTRRTSEIAAG
jgi:hypothetical protein